MKQTIKKNKNMLKDTINKTIMVSSRYGGIHYGKLLAFQLEPDTYFVKLEDAKRVFSWTGANSLSQLCMEGSKRTDSEISVPVKVIYLKAEEIIEMTDIALKNLNAITPWKYKK